MYVFNAKKFHIIMHFIKVQISPKKITGSCTKKLNSAYAKKVLILKL